MNYPNAADIPYEWKTDDVILDLYEVQTVTEGFGSHSQNSLNDLVSSM